MIRDRAWHHETPALQRSVWGIPTDRALGLGFACAVAAAGPVLVLVDGINPLLRVVLGLLLVALAPGYTVMLAACPGPAIAGTERLVLSVGVSMTLSVLGGLFLNWTPWGLQPESWVVLLSGVTLVAAAVALARQRGLPTTAQVGVRPRPARGGLGLGSVCLLTLAVTIISATILLARISAATPIEAGFSDLWMLPTDGAATPGVRLGVRSQEEASTSYLLRLDVDGAPVTAWHVTELAPGETWEATVGLPPGIGRSAVVEARLYRAEALATDAETVREAEIPYRRVVLRR